MKRLHAITDHLKTSGTLSITILLCSFMFVLFYWSELERSLYLICADSLVPAAAAIGSELTLTSAPFEEYREDEWQALGAEASSVTRQYIRLAVESGHRKYTSPILQDPAAINRICRQLDALASRPYLCAVYVVDRNGWIAWTSASAREPLRGTLSYDRKHNKLHTVMPELSAERIDDVRPGKPILITGVNTRICSCAITVNGSRWGTLVAEFRSEYIYNRKKDYIYNAAMVSIAGLIVICGIL